MNKVKTKKKEIGMDDLARMMANGFSELEGKMDKKFETVDKKFNLIFDDLGLIKGDIADMKRTLGPLVQTMGIQDNEMKKMNLRVTRLEKFTGVGGR